MTFINDEGGDGGGDDSKCDQGRKKKDKKEDKGLYDVDEYDRGWMIQTEKDKPVINCLRTPLNELHLAYSFIEIPPAAGNQYGRKHFKERDE